MGVFWIEKDKQGQRRVTYVDYATDQVQQVSGDIPNRKQKAGQGGVWQQSRSNGFTGTEARLKKMIELDRSVGAPAINYRPTIQTTNVRGRKVAAYVAEFTDSRQKNNWLRAHNRFDADAAYLAPCPGDFYKNCPPEFER